MNLFQSARSAVCFAALVAGNAALADVTAQEVWDGWKAQMNVYGQNGITIGNESMSGNTLTVTDIAMDMSDDTTEVKGTIPNITLTENGDGTVGVTMSEEYPITINPVGEADQNRMVILLKTSGMTMTVRGAADDMTYDLAAARYSISVDEAIEEGKAVPIEATLNLNNVAGTYGMKTDDLRRLTYDIKAGSLDLLVDASDGSDTVSISGQSNGLAMQANAEMPLEFDQSKPEEMFANGFLIDGGYNLGPSAFIFDVQSATDDVKGTVQTGGTDVTIKLDRDVFSYDSASTALALSVSTQQLPFPVNVSLAESGVGMTMPLSKTEEPAPFSANFNLTDLTVNEEIWGMIDPGNQLPHEPATARIDVSGTGKLLFDLTNPAQAEAMAGAEMPGELNTLKLNQLKLAIAGALLTGDGAFTFDNTDLVTFEGMPRPEGTLNLQATGINGLMDKLVAMGLVPEQQMMGARMMLGMFATVVGDDQLTSTVEINPAGEVNVNGQRIK